MSKRTIYTSVTPLPPNATRAMVVSFLHEHLSVIDLSPLVENRRALERPPGKSTPEEYHASWYEITDRISYMPGIKGKITYNVCFHDLDNGVQSRVYAPMGVDIKDKWTVGGNELGEPRAPVEMGLEAPKEGLYLREDVDFRSNMFLTKTVKKGLVDGHKVMVERLFEKAKISETRTYNERLRSSMKPSSPSPYGPYPYPSGPGAPPFSPTQQHPNFQNFQNYHTQQPDQQPVNHNGFRNEKSPAYQNYPGPSWAQPNNAQQQMAPEYNNTEGETSHHGSWTQPQSGAVELATSHYPTTSSGFQQGPAPAPMSLQYTELPNNDHKEPVELA